MQQAGDDLEESSNLPLPPDIDGNQETAEEETLDTEASAHAEIEQVSEDPDDVDLHRPPRFLSTSLEPSEPSDHPEMDTFSVGKFEVESQEGPFADHGGQLSEGETKILDSMVEQAMLSAQMSVSIPLPWETGIMATIFGETPLQDLPSIPSLQHSIPGFQQRDLDDTPEDSSRQVKRRRGEDYCVKLYERAISFGNTLTDKELDDTRWSRALEKLYAVMVSSPGVKPDGIHFRDDDMELNLRQIRILCGSRSPNTVTKRAKSLVKFCLWHKSFYYRRAAIPFSNEDVSDYIWERHQDGATYSSLTAFVEALNFAQHVLGLPVLNPKTPLVSTFAKGILDKMATTRPARQQARPLKTSEVIFLEEMVSNRSLDVKDRYAAGAFLFALYGRCRWSDLRRVNKCELDVSIVKEQTIGFVEFHTFSHKTAAQVAKHGLPMPLIAPIWGLTHPAWALAWKSAADEAGLTLGDINNEPILPAPTKTGH